MSADSEPPSRHLLADVDISIADRTVDWWKTKPRYRRHSHRCYTFRNFILSWLSKPGGVAGRRTKEFLSILREPLVLQALESHKVRVSFADETNPNPVVSARELRSEFKALLGHGPFSTLNAETLKDDGGTPAPDEETTIQSVCTTSRIDSTLKMAWETMESQAPRSLAFFSALATLERAHQTSYHGNAEDGLPSSYRGMLYVIMSLFLSGFAPRRSNFFSRLFALYLNGNGTSRRVIDTCSRLGLTPGYTSFNEMVKQLSDQARVGQPVRHRHGRQANIDRPT